MIIKTVENNGCASTMIVTKTSCIYYEKEFDTKFSTGKVIDYISKDDQEVDWFAIQLRDGTWVRGY